MLKDLWELFIAFAKIGVMTFGGGMAMLPMLQRELIDNRHWTTEEEIMDYFAIGQCTPGIIAVNTATFVGQKRRGDLGGIVARWESSSRRSSSSSSWLTPSRASLTWAGSRTPSPVSAPAWPCRSSTQSSSSAESPSSTSALWPFSYSSSAPA